MKLLFVVVILGFAAYAASQTINCFQCSAGVFDSLTFPIIPRTNACLERNNTTRTVTCPATTQCYTRLKTALGFAYGIQRGCWDDDDEACAEYVSNNCAGTLGTGTCLRCCNTDRCNGNFAQRDGVKNGVPINCFQCQTNVSDSVVGGITVDNPCLAIANNQNTTIETVACPASSKCYTKIRTVAQYAVSIERGCQDCLGDDCDAKEEDGCNGLQKTGTCFKSCNTNRCNKNFAQLAGVKNGVSGSHLMSVLALLPVAMAMLL